MNLPTPVIDGRKRCADCKEPKLLAEFSLNQRRCKACGRKRANLWRQQHPERVRIYQRQWKANNPPDLLAKRAHNAVARAHEKGTLIKPDHCAACPATGITAHHDDYAKPLDVIWLCGVCHAERHKRLGWGVSGTKAGTRRIKPTTEGTP